MKYLPQFKFPTPPGMRDVPHEYACTLTALAGGLAANSSAFNLPFKLDDDADFYCRAITGDYNNGATVGYMQLQDSFGRFLFVAPQQQTADTFGWVLIENIIGGMAGPAYVFDPEIWMPANSIIQFSFKNPTAFLMPSVTPVLRGIKRCKGCPV